MIKGYLKPKTRMQNSDAAESILGTVSLFAELKGTRAEVVRAVNAKIAELEELRKKIESTVEGGEEKIEKALKQFEETAISLIKDIQSIPQLQGLPGKNADEEEMLAKLLSRVPKNDIIDEEKLLTKFISKLPKNKASLKVIQESFDPEVVVKRIVDLANKGEIKIPHSGVIGTETAMESYLRKYGYKPYIHGGGDTVGAGNNITIATVNGVKIISSTGGGGSGYQAPTGTVNGVNRIFTYLTAPNAIVVDGLSIRKTASDGAVNWTGTTVVTLAVAPNFDTFAVA